MVPIVTGRERRVDGVIHGSSGSGATVFVEPLETIELNNELVRLHEEELREVHRLLREFTTRLREHAVEIAASVAALSRLELLFGKAEFAAEFRCSVPRLSPEGSRKIVLRGARHPLLEDILRGQKKTVVPVSLELNAAQNTLLISGPNTGGKTVALKTIGLLALMTHAGLPDARGRSRVPAVRRGAGRYRRSPVAGREPELVLVAHRGGAFDARTGNRAIRWCCWTNSAGPPIPKKAERWA